MSVIVSAVRIVILPIATVAVVVFCSLGKTENPRGQLSRCNLGGQMPPSFDQDVARVVAEVDRIEADTLSQMEHTTLDRQGQVHTLGKLLLFDKHLSVNQNEACSFCHTPETGFTGPIQALNQSTLSYPGSLKTRFSNRKPA